MPSKSPSLAELLEQLIQTKAADILYHIRLGWTYDYSAAYVKERTCLGEKPW